MQVPEWRRVIGEMVRDHMRSPELEHYFSVRMNPPRAQLMISQLGLYIRHRRDCWSHVSGNCPIMAMKQKFSSMNLAKSSKTSIPNTAISNSSLSRRKRSAWRRRNASA